MDDIERLYEHQTMMAVSIYSFLDNLLSALRSRPSSPPPPQIQMQAGGYSEDLFIYLSEKEKDELQCSICYSILRKPHQCQNKHLFCYSCVYVWSHTPGGGHDRCPMCRADGLYAENESVAERINRKRVKCVTEGCNWRGYLRDYDEHKHRQYEPSEIDMPSVELPAISSKFTSNVSTSTFLRQMNASHPAEETSAPAQPESRASNLAASRAPVPPARRQTVADVNATRRPARRPDPAARRGSGPAPATAAQNRNQPGGNGFTRPGMIPRPPTTPRPTNARSVRTGTNTVARRPSQPVRPPPVAEETSSGDGAATSDAARPPETVDANRNVAAAAGAEAVSPPEEAGATAAVPAASAASAAPAGARSAAEATGERPTETARIAGLEYRRLANPQPQRPHAMTDRLTHGRDQLFLLMTLMSYELEERRRAIEEFQTMNVERERVRLQQLSEVQTLNRRLTLVTNNLSRLLDGRNGSPSPRFRSSMNNNNGARARLNSSHDSSDSDDGLPHRLL